MIAGPNGSGKTTTAQSLMSSTTVIDEYINADEIARGLAPVNPESVSLAASKLMLKRFMELLEANKNFAFETTGASTNYIKHLSRAMENGYEVCLIFLWLPSPDIAVKRVAERVKQGGHDIPKVTIIRRYYLGLKNLMNHYLPLCTTGLVLDNSKSILNKTIAKKNKDNQLIIQSQNLWDELEKVAYAK